MGAKQEVMRNNYEADGDEAEGAVDWNFPPEALSAAETASRRVARRFEGLTEQADLWQDALLYMAERPALVARRLEQGGEDYLRWSLESMLQGRMKTQRRRADRNVSLNDEMGAGRL